MMKTHLRRQRFASLLCVLVLLGTCEAQAPGTLAERIQQIVSRPVFRHANFGVAFYSLDTDQPIYRLNADKLFTPASTTKLLTEGTVLTLLGADYRFHTRVYRTGPISKNTLKGDLVLVASGDPNLSGRIQPDGTLAFENEDHSYAGSPDTKAVPGDPLAVIRELAKQVAARGIKRINGRVVVDASLFPEGQPELGTRVMISPIVVNDNIVDVTATPAETPGAPATLKISPETRYVRFINNVTTGAADTRAAVRFNPDVANADGSHTVTVTGSMPVGKPSILYAYRVPEPTRFAEMVLVKALQEAGVRAKMADPAKQPDWQKLKASYTPENVVAEHISPPLAEEVKVTLKVSQNLHASMGPFLLGALLAHKTENIAQAGFDLEHDFLQKAGLDLSGASQGDGAGGATSAFFTPDFMVHYLAYMSKQKEFPIFYPALPILGRDGTLWNIQVDSPAAGQVHAKTGTFGAYNNLNRTRIVTGKGLAGYLTTVDGRRLAFAAYANNVEVPANDPDATTKIVGQALGEIAAAAYDSPAPGAQGSNPGDTSKTGEKPHE